MLDLIQHEHLVKLHEKKFNHCLLLQNRYSAAVKSLNSMMSAYVLMALVVMLPLQVLLHSRQSHVYNNHVSDLAIDGDSDTCMSTGNNIGAWWMRTWDSPVTFHSVRLSG